MRRRLVYLLLILAFAGGLTWVSRAREAETTARMTTAVETWWAALRRDPTAPIPVTDPLVSGHLHRLVPEALAVPGDGAVEVRVEPVDRSGLRATHEATVRVGGQPVIVLGLVLDGDAVVVAGVVLP